MITLVSSSTALEHLGQFCSTAWRRDSVPDASLLFRILVQRWTASLCSLVNGDAWRRACAVLLVNGDPWPLETSPAHARPCRAAPDSASAQHEVAWVAAIAPCRVPTRALARSRPCLDLAPAALHQRCPCCHRTLSGCDCFGQPLSDLLQEPASGGKNFFENYVEHFGREKFLFKKFS